MTNAVSIAPFSRNIAREDSMATLITRWNEQQMFGIGDEGNARTVREYADMCGYRADDGTRYGQAIAYLDAAHEAAMWDDSVRGMTTAEVALAQMIYERDAALARAAHMEAGLDLMTKRHDGFVSHLRNVAADYAQHGEWCSVYEQAMSDLGVSPLSLNATVSLQITVQIPVTASRRQRANASEDFIDRSYAYGVRDDISSALNQVVFFDSDYSMVEGSVYVSTIECVGVETQDEDA